MTVVHSTLIRFFKIPKGTRVSSICCLKCLIHTFPATEKQGLHRKFLNFLHACACVCNINVGVCASDVHVQAICVSYVSTHQTCTMCMCVRACTYVETSMYTDAPVQMNQTCANNACVHLYVRIKYVCKNSLHMNKHAPSMHIKRLCA